MRGSTTLLLGTTIAAASCQWIAGIDVKQRGADDGGTTSTSGSSGGTGGASASSSSGVAGAASGGSCSFGAGGGGTGGSAACLASCGGACADTLSDPMNCGACGVRCLAGVTCDGGICGRSLYRGPGSDSPCAAKPDGALWCWGANTWYQVGLGTVGGNVYAPTVATVLGKTQSVRYAASTGYTTCALSAGGRVSCFGGNGLGELGDSSVDGPQICPATQLKNCRAEPYDTVSCGIVELSGSGWWDGGSHFCARTTQGAVYCWGDLSGVCGTKTAAAMPTRVPGLDGVLQIASGQGFACALRNDGTVWCWGTNCSGALGQGDFDDHPGGVLEVHGLTGVTTIGTGLTHACASASDGLYCWGNNVQGQLGIGSMSLKVATPTKVVATPGLVDVVQVAGGVNATCALVASGHVFCWGANNDGLMGIGTAIGGPCPQGGSVCYLTPTQTSVTGAVEIAMGNITALARLANGALVAWGSNGWGQAGTGLPGADLLSPSQVANFP